jgi:hypothetical protein
MVAKAISSKGSSPGIFELLKVISPRALIQGGTPSQDVSL